MRTALRLVMVVVGADDEVEESSPEETCLTPLEEKLDEEDGEKEWD